MNNLHDKFVKDRLQNKQNAIDFLKIAVPQDVLSVISLETITPTQSSFMVEDMKELFADIIYNCKLKSGKEGYCSILIEHKSYKDPFIGFQINGYLAAAYNQQIENKEPFKAIIPLVFYHHQGEWQYRPIASYFEDIPQELLRFIPRFDIIPFDVNQQSDETLLSIRNVAISTMILTQKHYRNPYELIEKMEKIYESLQTQEEMNSFKTNFVYIMLLSKKEDNIIEIFQKNSDKLVNQVFMTLYEEITLQNKMEGEQIGIQKGEQIGIQKGEQIGIQKGKQIGIQKEKIEVVLTLNDDQIPVENIAKYTRLSVAEVLRILSKNGREK
jgi:predicted transposase/invertase (TIGR01784 family)